MRLSISLRYLTLLCLSVCGGWTADLPNLARLEASLRRKPEQLLEPAALLAALEGQVFLAVTNSGLLTEWALQSTYPYVAVAGLAGLQRKNPELAYRVALNRLWCGTNIASPLTQGFLVYLTNRISTDGFDAAFSAVALIEPRDPRSTSVILRQLPLERLIQWLLSEDRVASVTVQALVIDRLMSARKGLRDDQLVMVAKRLEDLRVFPGIARVIFLLHSEGGGPALVSVLMAVAEDETVDVLHKQMAFRKHAKSMNGLLNVDQMEVSELDKQRYKGWLLKYSQ